MGWLETQRQLILQEWRVLVLTLGFATAVSITGTSISYAVYELPADDEGCPANCRQIPWKAGSDVWNGGTLPSYVAVPCTSGLTEGNGTTDNTSAINACLNALGTGQASVLPAGMYYVSGSINIPSNRVLRGAGSTNCSQNSPGWITASFHGDVGAGATCTTLKFGTGGSINMPGNSSLGTAINLSSGYDKGSTALVTSSTPSGIATNDWIVVSELEDSAIPSTIRGDNGACTWCGEANATSRPMTQIVQVTSVSGTTVNISRPMYYTFKAGLSPRIREITGTGTKAGIENIKLWGFSNSRGDAHIEIHGCMLCWVKSVETYNTPDAAKAYPIYMVDSYGNEIRDSYFHFGQANGSDRNYGLGMFGPNSDHKVENNIYREQRHALAQEGGGSGNVFLYNYIDDMWTDDASYLARTTLDHGAHPYMFLLEGNIVSHYGDDNIWGSSSHGVLFRNHLWGDATGNYASWSSVNWGFVAMDIERNSHYMAALGNVLGNTSASTGPTHVNWNTGVVYQGNCSWGSSKSAPVAYGLGCGGSFDSAVRSTAILHGNYDYKTQGVAFWDGGTDHTIRSSMYYGSKPSFFGSCAWPPFDGTASPPTINTLPARERYQARTACGGPSGGGPSDLTPPAAPQDLRILQ